MKAIVCNAYGGPSTLVLEEIPSLKPAKGQVRIAVKACGVNFPDTLIIEGKYQFKPEPPFTPGGEVAGIILEIGDGVKHHKVGDAVFALTSWGGFAEEVLAPAHQTFPMPPGMDFVTASSMMYTYGTSYHALKDRAMLQPNETILVLGAAGGVGLAAVQLAVLMGATVIAAASSDEKLAVCKTYGATHTINYLTENLKEKVKELTNGKGVDVVYDPVGDVFAEPAIRSMAWKGRYLVVGFAGGQIPKIPLNLTLLKGCAVMGVFWGQFATLEPQQSMKNFIDIVGWISAGKLSQHIHKIYPLAQAPQALQDLADRRVVGKAIIEVSAAGVKPAPVVEAIKTAEAPSDGVRKVGNGLVFKNLAALKSFQGKAIGTSEWQAVTQEMINDFAKATLDFQWIHVDEARAKSESPFGQTIAHGFLTLCLSPVFMYELMQVQSAKLSLNYGTNKVRFITPVPSGSKVRMSAVLKSVENIESGGVRTIVEATIELYGSDRPACVAELISVIRE